MISFKDQINHYRTYFDATHPNSLRIVGATGFILLAVIVAAFVFPHSNVDPLPFELDKEIHGIYGRENLLDRNLSKELIEDILLMPEPLRTRCLSQPGLYDISIKYDSTRWSQSMTRCECRAAFPKGYHYIDQTILPYLAVPERKITRKFLDDQGGGVYRTKIVKGKAYFTRAQDGEIEKTDLTRPWANLLLILMSTYSAPYQDPLPDIMFTWETRDKPVAGAFGLSRKNGQFKNLAFHERWRFLLPDFGFWSWPEPKVMSFFDVLRKIETVVEKDLKYENKSSKLFWRGPLAPDHAPWPRKKLFEGHSRKPYADIEKMTWSGQGKDLRYKSMPEHCLAKWVAHTEGLTYSGRLKHLLGCSSVVITHPLWYDQHFHHLLVPDGDDQNLIITKDERWSDLDQYINILSNDSYGNEYAKKIIKNAHDTFKKRYFTMPAISCYLRELFHEFARIMAFVPIVEETDLEVESFVLMRNQDWKMT